MTLPPETQTPPIPSAGRLAKTTAFTLATAIVLLVTIVVPAEYGYDPLGTGRLLGLTRLSAPQPVAEPVAPPAGAPLAPTVQGPAAVYATAFKVDSTQFVLPPYQYIEYKYHLAKGAAMMYAWKGTAAVRHDFHGEADGTTDAPVSYEKKDASQESGVFTAPFSGIHGWYWENPGGEPITITVTSAGFYTAAMEFRSNRTRHPHVLADADAIRPTPAP